MKTHSLHLTNAVNRLERGAPKPANPLEHQQNGAFEHDEHAAKPDESFYAQNEHEVSTDEHADGESGFAPLSPDRAEELSNHGAGKNPEEFIEKIKSLGEEK